jgi:hypothetical protein
MTHTPGPWVTADTKFAGGIRTEVEAAGECGPICACIRTLNARKVRSWDEVDANAKLIAAAPELLAALKQCREALLHLCHNCPAFEDDAPEFNEGGIGYEACGKAIEIINKAEGRTN